MKDFQRWIYHKTKKPKVIYDSQFEQYEALGWCDSPARFLKLESVGIDKEKIDSGDEKEAAKAQQALDAVEGVVSSLNGSLNIGKMKDKELQDHIKEHFGIELEKAPIKVMRAKAIQIIKGQ